MLTRHPSQALLTAAPGNASRIPLPWTLLTLLAALLLAAGGIIALADPILLVPPSSQITEAARIYAGYLASRNLALTIMLVALLVLRAKHSLAVLMALAALSQFIDAVIDAAEARWPIVPGVLLLGLLFLLTATRLADRPLWKRTASTL